MFGRAVAGDETRELQGSMTAAPTEETTMEMSWMETVRLLGLDLLCLMLMALVVFDVVEHALHSAWVTARARAPRLPEAKAATRVNIGGFKHV
jgi:hypothetical protein